MVPPLRSNPYGVMATANLKKVIDKPMTQCYCCVMIPPFNSDGNLPPGIHWATWSEIFNRYGSTLWRRQLLAGLRASLDELKRVGCSTVYLDGSFVSAKLVPGDFDCCWEEAGIDFNSIDPVLLDFGGGRATQKAKFGGELFPANEGADGRGSTFLDFFQTDKDTGNQKGIVALGLGGLK